MFCLWIYIVWILHREDITVQPALTVGHVSQLTADRRLSAGVEPAEAGPEGREGWLLSPAVGRHHGLWNPSGPWEQSSQIAEGQLRVTFRVRLL